MKTYPLSPVKCARLRSGLALPVVLFACLASSSAGATSIFTDIVDRVSGSKTTEQATQLERCQQTLGTIRISEDTNASWYRTYRSRYRGLGSTVPALRVLIQKSNCFVIVERGRHMRQINAELKEGRGGEVRSGSRVQKGQRVFADYTMVPEVTMSEKGTSGVGGNLFGRAGNLFNTIAGSIKKNESGTVLLLLDNRSSVQISASEGYSSSTNMNIAGGLFGGRGGASGGAFTRTPEGKTIMAAFVDSYNKMVVSLRQYKAQTVKGGLGRGGRLGVQGGQTPAGQNVRSK